MINTSVWLDVILVVTLIIKYNNNNISNNNNNNNNNMPIVWYVVRSDMQGSCNSFATVHSISLVGLNSSWTQQQLDSTPIGCSEREKEHAPQHVVESGTRFQWL
jgi:hypothetical protein